MHDYLEFRFTVTAVIAQIDFLTTVLMQAAELGGGLPAVGKLCSAC